MAASQFDLDGFLNAWSEGNVDKLNDYFTDDVEYLEPGVAEPVTGVEEVRTRQDRFLGAFGGLDVSDRKAFVQADDTVSFLVRATGTHTGNYYYGNREPVTGTNEDVDLWIAGFMDINNDGLIQSMTLIYDTGELHEQIGVTRETTTETTGEVTGARNVS